MPAEPTNTSKPQRNQHPSGDAVLVVAQGHKHKRCHHHLAGRLPDKNRQHAQQRQHHPPCPMPPLPGLTGTTRNQPDTDRRPHARRCSHPMKGIHDAASVTVQGTKWPHRRPIASTAKSTAPVRAHPVVMPTFGFLICWPGCMTTESPKSENDTLTGKLSARASFFLEDPDIISGWALQPARQHTRGWIGNSNATGQLWHTRLNGCLFTGLPVHLRLQPCWARTSRRCNFIRSQGDRRKRASCWGGQRFPLIGICPVLPPREAMSGKGPLAA